MLKQQQKHERRSVELYREKAQDAVQRKLRVGEIKRLVAAPLNVESQGWH